MIQKTHVIQPAIAAVIKKTRHKNTSPWGMVGSKRGHYRFFRRPKTMRTLRLLCWNELSDGKPNYRGGRKPVPTSWDDVYRSNVEIRSWKNYRKQQYVACYPSFRAASI